MKYWDIKPTAKKKKPVDSTPVTVVLQPGDVIVPKNRQLTPNRNRSVDTVTR